jgi:hypothetical protein
MIPQAHLHIARRRCGREPEAAPNVRTNQLPNTGALHLSPLCSLFHKKNQRTLIINYQVEDVKHGVSTHRAIASAYCANRAVHAALTKAAKIPAY